MVLARVGWLMVLSPPLASHLSTYIEITGVAAEGSLMLWLIVVGVNIPKWSEKAQRANQIVP